MEPIAGALELDLVAEIVHRIHARILDDAHAGVADRAIEVVDEA